MIKDSDQIPYLQKQWKRKNLWLRFILITVDFGFVKLLVNWGTLDYVYNMHKLIIIVKPKICYIVLARNMIIVTNEEIIRIKLETRNWMQQKLLQQEEMSTY